MPDSFPYHIYPLGETTITVDFGNKIDRQINERVMALYQYLAITPWKSITDIVPAYSSLTLHYNLVAWSGEIAKGLSVFDILKDKLIHALTLSGTGMKPEVRTVSIPVCYESTCGPDLKAVAQAAGIGEQEVIKMHTSISYHVYMLGFLPGFAYMGEVQEAIATPRKSRPQPIVAGSVGIAGRQTGIYPMDSPGGWQIIGRTPLAIFTPATGDALLRPGDCVQFYPISIDEFKHY
jgi:inhibitor of KinA